MILNENQAQGSGVILVVKVAVYEELVAIDGIVVLTSSGSWDSVQNNILHTYSQ